MDRLFFRQWVRSADHDHARIRERDAAVEPLAELHAEARKHSHVQLPFGQRAEQALVAAELKLDLRFRVLAVIFVDLRNDGPQLVGPGVADAQIRRSAERDFLALRRGVVVADHELLALPVEHLARRRQAHAALAAHKQRIAELLLEQLDLLADGRLRDALLLGSAGKIEVLCS